MELNMATRQTVRLTAETLDGQELDLSADIATDETGRTYIVFDGVAYPPAVAQAISRLLDEAVAASRTPGTGSK